MPYYHDAHLANIVTSYCTCLAGLLPMIYCLITGNQPARWFFAYACILLTGIPTVWLHTVEGHSRIASFADVGTNIFLAWALQVAASGDFLSRPARAKLLAVSTLLNVAAVAWLVYEIVAPKVTPVLTFGSFGQFYFGEVVLILNCWVVVAIFAKGHRQIPAAAKPFFHLVVLLFLVGMFVAAASGKQISFYIFPWHAAWHILGAFGFMTLWICNHIRFTEATGRLTITRPDRGSGA